MGDSDSTTVAHDGRVVAGRAGAGASGSIRAGSSGKGSSKRSSLLSSFLVRCLLPKGYRWDDLTKREGVELLDYYKKLLLAPRARN